VNILKKDRKDKRTNIRKKLQEIIVIVGTFCASAIVMGIIAIMTFGIDRVKNITDYMLHHRKPSIVAEKTEVNYLKQQELEQDNFYPLFSQELVPGTHYNLARTCATQIYITNHYKSEIVLSKIRFVAEDIEKINEPVVYVDVIENEGYVSLKFTNVGWRTTGDFHVKLKGVEEDLTDYFNEDKLKLDVKNLKSKEFVEVKIWEDKDLKNHPEEYKTIPFTVECMKGNRELDVRYSLEIKKEYMSYVTFDIYEGKLQRLGRGGEVGFLYGIPINTNKKKYVYKETIEEYIEPEEIVTFPICFFPEQSCNMRFHIEFEARYGAKKIELKTEPIEMTFETYSLDENVDITKLTQNEMDAAKQEEGTVYGLTYPYTGKLVRRSQ